MPDKAIAGLLNRTGKRTGRLNGWTPVRRVRNFLGQVVARPENLEIFKWYSRYT